MPPSKSRTKSRKMRTSKKSRKSRTSKSRKMRTSKSRKMRKKTRAIQEEEESHQFDDAIEILVEILKKEKRGKSKTKRKSPKRRY